MPINLKSCFAALSEVPGGGDIYACPAATQAWIKTIVIVNLSNAPATFSLWLGTAISPVSQPLAAGAAYFDTNGYALMAGETLGGSVDSGSNCSVCVAIVEKA